MSATALMETFDTHMFDSSDGDIPMYTGAGSSEPWLSVEATMADEDSNTGPHPYHTEESVEIEMTDHQDEITEYEMADEPVYARENDAEVVDVDLVDISRQASPPLNVPPLSVSLFHSDAGPSYERSLSIASFGHSIDSAPNPHLGEAVERATAPLVGDNGVTLSVSAPQTMSSDEHVLSVAQDVEQVADSSVSPLALTNDISIRLSEEGTAMEAAVDHDPEIASNLVNIDSTYQHETVSEEVHGAEDKGRGDDFSIPQQADRLSPPPPPPPPPITALPAEQDEAPTVDSQEVETLLEGAAREQGTIDESHAPTDPHEISEGVYIDPPPAVLLTVSTSSQPLDCCLFNEPAQSLGSQNSPSSGAAERDLLLLLHHRPTLYYESLSVVFDALRQEEHVQNVYDLEREELVLDAYDLELTISEDNVHVQEVTLHDLNVLHDSADLTGPLRLELRVMPRFITRYNALRDQMARLDLAVEEERVGEPHIEHRGEDDAVPTHVANEHSDAHEEKQGQEQEAEEYTPQEETGEQDVTSHEQANVGEDQMEGAPVSESTQEETEHHEQGIQEPQQDEYDGAQDEAQEEDSPYESGEVQGFIDENALNAGGDILDADEIHQYADAEESGDYVDEKEVAPEDDEQQFGSDLAEDFGGEQAGDPEERQAFKDATATNVDDENSAPSGGIDVLETPAFLDGGFSTVPEDQYDAKQCDEDGFSDAGETLHTDISGSAQEDNVETVNYPAKNIADDLEEYDDKLTTGPADNLDPTSSTATGDEEWPLEYPEEDYAAPLNAEHDFTGKSSTMSSSNRSSKRGHDEVELDDDEDDSGSYSQSSPDVKKARIQ